MVNEGPFEPPEGFHEADPDTSTSPGDVWIGGWRVDVPNWVPFDGVIESFIAGAKTLEREINAQISGEIEISRTWVEQRDGATYLFIRYKALTSPALATVAGYIGSASFWQLLGAGFIIGIVIISFAHAWKSDEPADVGGGLGTGALLLGGLFILSQSSGDGGALGSGSAGYPEGDSPWGPSETVA